MPLFASTPSSAKPLRVPQMQRGNRPYPCPNMMGSETFIMVAFSAEKTAPRLRYQQLLLEKVTQLLLIQGGRSTTSPAVTGTAAASD